MIALCLAGLGLYCQPAPLPPQEPPPPALLPVAPGLNVIVVSFDALRADALGTYGSSRGATPNMDRFAAESLVFENAYSVAPVTPTSFAAAFTGFLPTRVFHAWELKAPQTLASRFSAAGYHTAAFLNNVHLTAQRGFDRGFDEFYWSRNDPDEAVLATVESWLEEESPRPLFLWVHFLAPHAPYRARQEAAHLYREGDPGRFAKTSGNHFETSEPTEIARLHDLYLGEVWRADRIFGQLVDRLRDVGLYDSSMVILTSDHGEEFGEHGGFQHGRLYEEHLRIPLILRHPELSGGTIEMRVRNVDLFPTLLQGIGEPVEGILDGRVISQSTKGAPPPVVAISMTGAESRWASLLDGSLKLIVHCGAASTAELYDLAADPGELRDLAEDRPGIVRRLLGNLRKVLGNTPCTAMQEADQGRAPTVGLDRESIEALRALGYLN